MTSRLALLFLGVASWATEAEEDGLITTRAPRKLVERAHDVCNIDSNAVVATKTTK